MTASSDHNLRDIGAYLAQQPGMRLGLVFGSMACGRATASSDLDLAVLADQPLDSVRRSAIVSDLSQRFGRPVDLVDLANAGVPSLRSALLGGKVVYAADDDVYPAQITRMLFDSADFLPYRERILKARRDAWLG
ncbi:DNA polymerase beta domain-containing protein [Salinisphaera shabanensis T35B1]|jgi:predicted nucleotidyltransferase|nr:nucleotidyltransferase domain-containing protein [Salinisphaera shabanensis]